MIFKVYLMRIGGRRRPWRDILNSPAYVGDLRTVTEKRVLSATLHEIAEAVW